MSAGHICWQEPLLSEFVQPTAPQIVVYLGFAIAVSIFVQLRPVDYSAIPLGPTDAHDQALRAYNSKIAISARICKTIYSTLFLVRCRSNYGMSSSRP